MVLNRQTSTISNHHFSDLLDLLTPNDVLVLNQSKVFPARIFGKKISGGLVEVLLYHQDDKFTWHSITKPGLKVGTVVNFSQNLSAVVLDRNFNTGETVMKFNIGGIDFFSILSEIGLTPIPPYIKPVDNEKTLRQKYQTVYAKEIGSAAAPTAGLHFTQKLLSDLKNLGVGIEFITLHVGLGTFKPLQEENLKTGKLHTEFFEIGKDTAKRLNQAKKDGKRIIAVGTTSVRALESAAEISPEPRINPKSCSTDIFIYPPYKFKFVDALITNFHLPESSLLMLVTAFTCRPNSSLEYKNFSDSLVGKAYTQAITEQYRFFSFGDAMFIS
jgi:S-adenosylmethionine:tRNA ribosyltransferase-isomerase